MKIEHWVQPFVHLNSMCTGCNNDERQIGKVGDVFIAWFYQYILFMVSTRQCMRIGDCTSQEIQLLHDQTEANASLKMNSSKRTTEEEEEEEDYLPTDSHTVLEVLDLC